MILQKFQPGTSRNYLSQHGLVHGVNAGVGFRPRLSGHSWTKPVEQIAAVFLSAQVLLPIISRRVNPQHKKFNGSKQLHRRTGRITARAAKQKNVKISENLPVGVDYYRVLDVRRDATQDEIRAAYKKVIRQTHPDVNPAPEATEKFIQAQEAFRWLSDPLQREVYDNVGDKFGQDALYDYSDEAILGSLSKIKEIGELTTAADLVNRMRMELTYKRVIKIDHDMKDLRQRFRKWGAQRIMWVKNYICRELRAVLQYPKLIRQLHPFERLSVELSLTMHMQRHGVAFGKLMGCLKELRVRIHEEGAARAHASSKAERGRMATLIADDSIREMFELLISYEPVFQQFKAAQRAIFKAPCIDLDKPTVVFVGAPNVGKSSLVRSLSTGVPEVNNYLFTTKHLTIGHMWHFISGTPLLVHGQIVDSPGLRTPSHSKHTLLDQLTMGSMKHLPSAVVFVFDPYPEACGLLDVKDQLELCAHLRDLFPKRPWLNVITKIDLQESVDGIEEISRVYPDAVQVSALEGTGLDELNMAVRRLLEEMTKVVRQLQRTKIRQLRVGETPNQYMGKEALVVH